MRSGAIVDDPDPSDSDEFLIGNRASGTAGFQGTIDDVRVFSGRTSSGVRGIKLAKGDAVISLSVLGHVEATTEERDAYVKLAGARRRAEDDEAEANCVPEGVELHDDRFAEFEAAEEFILSVTENGFGKRTSAYEYRVTGRGGQGIINIDTSERNGRVVATFPVAASDQIMLVTDGGQLIRCPVDDIRIASRSTQGVTLFKVDEDERVVSVARLGDVGDNGENGGDEDASADTGEGSGDE